MNTTITITPGLGFTVERIADLLCCALEGGSNYWYLIKEFRKPATMTNRTDADRVFKHLDYPTNEGGGLLITTLEGDENNGATEWWLDLPTMQRGLTVLAEKYPTHFADFAAENDDATTGDVFLQCCLFGEVVYG